MKNAKLFFKKGKTFSVAILFCLLFFSCAGQEEKKKVSLKFELEQSKVRGDLISMKAEDLPEFRLDPHDKEYQDNQISGVVRTVFQDKKGNYWFGTQDGLCRKNQNGLVYFDLKDSNGQRVTVHVILEDNAGIIWIGYGGGIAKYDGDYFTIFHEKELLVRSGLWSMTVDKKGILWIGTTQGVFTFDGTSLTPFEIPEGKIDSTRGISTPKMIHSIMEDSKGNIWFGTNGGAYRYDGKKLSAITEKEGLQSNFVEAILEDKQGIFWIATTRGLSCFNGEKLTNVTANIYDKNVGTSSLLQDKNGTMWFSSHKGRHIYSYKDKVFTKYLLSEGNYGPAAFQIYEDQQERLWFVGFRGAYRYDDKKFVNITRNGPW